ncbi:hypothetical protein D020_4779 [Vibrio parahaemolyticus SBR10290]|nr:hypothetical protein VP10329_09786 [Vibrio parahaemolyticus 10329]EQL85652.1 hypothetical protein D052_1604 [Vibrio parahaemolyticus 10290]EQL89626.1 hypothetical protein D019_3560 [Vibrio parahaemolyticus VP2007-095]ESV66055.1 hypothetical protein D021_4839 [Vibrio parahaemolyticus 10296]ESW41766.1 hypothetical protein D022_4777 [Vibrio parahaemolyticus 12310]ETT13509.1 hypothetical protein D028_4601 [Vibrio parahaemolyticus 50]ETT15684.1 hypothetical protein D023_4676 [Vibrio parahaemoly
MGFGCSFNGYMMTSPTQKALAEFYQGEAGMILIISFPL